MSKKKIFCVQCGKEILEGWLCQSCAEKLGQVPSEEDPHWWPEEKEWDPEEEPHEVNLGDDPGGFKIFE